MATAYCMKCRQKRKIRISAVNDTQERQTERYKAPALFVARKYSESGRLKTGFPKGRGKLGSGRGISYLI